MGPGPCRINWTGRMPDGGRVPAGVYWIRLDAGAESRRARFVQVR